MTDKSQLLAERQTGLGGSDAAAVLGVHPFKSRLALWAEKTGRQKPVEENLNMRIGTKMEPVIIELFGEETGYHLMQPKKEAYRHPDHDEVLVHVDHLYEKDMEPHVLECKHANYFASYQYEKEPPAYALMQVQHAMMVKPELKGGAVAAIAGGNFQYMEVDPNPSFQDHLLEACLRFWHDHVKADVAPAPTDSDQDREVISLLFPRDTGETLDMSDMAQGFDHWDALKEKAKEIKAELREVDKATKEVENLIRMEMGTATTATVGDRVYTLKTTDRKGYEVKPTSYRVLRKAKVTK